MIDILNCIAASFVNHKRYKDLRINNLSINIQNRNVYDDSHVYDEYTMELISLIDDGEWFDKTVRFEVIISSCRSQIKVRSGYGDEYINFKYKDYKNISDFIVDEIMKIQNKDFNSIKKVI